MKPLFASDCLSCHNNSRFEANYRMTTYEQVMRQATAGWPSSRLVAMTQPNGAMFGYFSGSNSTRQAKADQVWKWIVTYKAQETK